MGNMGSKDNSCGLMDCGCYASIFDSKLAKTGRKEPYGEP